MAESTLSFRIRITDQTAPTFQRVKYTVKVYPQAQANSLARNEVSLLTRTTAWRPISLIEFCLMCTMEGAAYHFASGSLKELQSPITDDATRQSNMTLK